MVSFGWCVLTMEVRRGVLVVATSDFLQKQIVHLNSG